MFEQQPDPSSTPPSPEGAEFTPTGNRPATNARQATPGSVLGQGPMGGGDAVDFLDLGSEFGGVAPAPAGPPPPVAPAHAQPPQESGGQGWLPNTEPAADEFQVLSEGEGPTDADSYDADSYEDDAAAEYDDYDEPEYEDDEESDDDEDSLPSSWVEQPSPTGKARKAWPKVAAAIVIGMLGMTGFYLYQSSRGGESAEVTPLSPELNTTPGYERRVIESSSEGAATGRRAVGKGPKGASAVTEVASAEPGAESESAEGSEPAAAAGETAPDPIWELTGQTPPPGVTFGQEPSQVAESAEPTGSQGETVLLGAGETTEVAEAEAGDPSGETGEIALAESSEPFGEVTEVAQGELGESFGETPEVESGEPIGETAEIAGTRTVAPAAETSEVAEAETAEAETAETFAETAEVAGAETAEPSAETAEVASAETAEPDSETPEVAGAETAAPFGETSEVAQAETAEPVGETPEVGEAETAAPFGETPEVAGAETAAPFGETPEVAEAETSQAGGETPEVAEAETETAAPGGRTTEVAQAETVAGAAAEGAPGTYGPALPAGVAPAVVEPTASSQVPSGTFSRVTTLPQSAVLQQGRGPRDATAVEMKGVWMETTVPMEGIFSADKLLTPRVGKVRVVLDKNEIFEGRLYAVGKGQVWIDNDKFGQLGLDGKRVQRVLQLDDQGNIPELGGAGAENLTGFDRVRVKTPGGTILGKVIARDEHNTTLLTDDGARVTLDSSKVEFLSESPTVALKHIEQEKAAQAAEAARLEKAKPEQLKESQDGADGEKPASETPPAPAVAETDKP